MENKIKKYYRYFVNDELENHVMFIEKIFDDIFIRRAIKGEIKQEK